MRGQQGDYIKGTNRAFPYTVTAQRSVLVPGPLRFPYQKVPFGINEAGEGAQSQIQVNGGHYMVYVPTRSYLFLD